MSAVRRFFRKTNTFVKRPRVLMVKLIQYFSPFLSDEIYLKLLFYWQVGYKLDLKNPQTFNEKLNWMKLYYQNPMLPVLCDKFEVKEYVGERIGLEHVVPNYGVWDNFDQIDFDKLPSAFVLKTTHDQGGVVVCTEKSNFEIEKARQKLNKHMRSNLYLKFRERPYRNVKPRIIAEQLLIGGESGLRDYKFFCFNGEVKLMYIATERSKGKPKFDFYDVNFNHLDIKQSYPQSDKILERPENFDVMISLASKLSKGFPQVRVDFYDVNGQVFFGEFTFFHHGGVQAFHPVDWDYELGRYIDLSPCLKTETIRNT